MSNQHKFKVGDKVRCIEECDYGKIFGKLGTVYTVGRLVYLGFVLEELGGKHCNVSRFELVQEEPFDVLKALREGKKICRKHWEGKHYYNYYYEWDGKDLKNSNGNMANMKMVFKYDDWIECKESRKVGLYWTVRDGCDYDDVSEWKNGKWYMPNTNMTVTVIKVGNKIERPEYV